MGKPAWKGRGAQRRSWRRHSSLNLFSFIFSLDNLTVVQFSINPEAYGSIRAVSLSSRHRRRSRGRSYVVPIDRPTPARSNGYHRQQLRSTSVRRPWTTPLRKPISSSPPPLFLVSAVRLNLCLRRPSVARPGHLQLIFPSSAQVPWSLAMARQRSPQVHPPPHGHIPPEGRRVP